MIEPHTDRLIAFLNELLALDQVWVQELIAARPVCNTDLALHPTVQVAVGGSNGAILIRPGEHRAGVLGLLNGFCGTLDGVPLTDGKSARAPSVSPPHWLTA